MIIKIFKISTKEMYKLKNKNELRDFIIYSVNKYPSKKDTIKKMISYLPCNEYYKMK